MFLIFSASLFNSLGPKYRKEFLNIALFEKNIESPPSTAPWTLTFRAVFICTYFRGRSTTLQAKFIYYILIEFYYLNFLSETCYNTSLLNNGQNKMC